MENRPKVNYGLLIDSKLVELEKSGERPVLLLHACCAPCSSHTLTVLEKYFRITLYFCNPNIAPEEEFDFRFAELKRLVKEMGMDIPQIAAVTGLLPRSVSHVVSVARSKIVEQLKKGGII